MRPYVIVTPSWCPSAGVRVLHELCHELRSQGLEAYLLITRDMSNGTAPLVNPAFHTPVLNGAMEAQWPRLQQEAITICPDSATPSEMGAKRVVRYVLGKEVPQPHDNPREFRVYWSRAYPAQRRGDHRILYLQPVDLGLFNDLNRPAPTQDMLWIGKGGRYVGPDVPQGPQVVRLTYEWPATRPALAAELRKTRYLYTYDTLSSTNLEAILCGGIVILKTMKYHAWDWTRRDIEATETGSGGYAFNETPYEIERAWATRGELVENIRHHKAMFRQHLWEFVQASQRHFRTGTSS